MKKDSILTYLFKKYPEKKWDINAILRNPNFTMENIKEFCSITYPYIKWKEYIKDISYNPNISIEFIEKNISNLDWNGISDNDNFITDINFIKKYSKFLNWDILSYKNIPINLIEKTHDLPWNWHFISCKQNLTISFIKKFINKPLVWDTISRNQCLHIGWFKTKMFRTKFNWNMLSQNPSITIEMLEQFPNEGWDFGKYGISSNSALTLEMLQKFPNKEWDLGDISSNSALTLEILQKFPNKEWHFGFRGISSNSSLTIECLKNFQTKGGILAKYHLIKHLQ